MLFNSYIFIFAFLPLCLAGYFFLNRLKWYTASQLFLFGMSLWFYGFFNPSYLPIILISILLNYSAAWIMDRQSGKTGRKMVMIFAVLGNISILFYYKYYDFFLSNIHALFASDYVLRNILLPLGISFFTFQQISYIVDAYRGEVSGYGFLQYASFVVYFPQLIAGPIVTHDELIPQMADREKKSLNWDHMARGIYMFALGLSKKVLIADMFGEAANWGFANIGALDSTNAILVTLAYTIQVYFDFSGYCDMAIGIAKMMNMDLPLNFNSPYKAATITEFWQRWHMTLTRFFTRYIYIPLGGNRKGALCTYRNIMIVYLVSGLWHGANWTFVFWGCLHGVCSVLTRQGKHIISRIPRGLMWLLTFVFVNITWIFFRADSIADGFALIGQILRFDFGPVHDSVVSAFNLMEIVNPVLWITDVNLNARCPSLLTVLAYTGTLTGAVVLPNAYERMQSFRCGVMEMLLTAFLLVWCVFSLSGVSTFLYFNF